MRRVLALFSPGRLVLAASMLVVAYMLVSAGGSFVESHRLSKEESRLQAEVDALQQQQAQLEQIRDYLRTDEYIEYMARRVFGLVKPGESLVIVKSPEQASAQEPPAGQAWWQNLFVR